MANLPTDTHQIKTELEEDKILTIAVPAYNAEKFLKRTLDPFTELRAEIKNYLEVIIVDDGSKDQTAVIADSYVQHWPELFKVVHKENGGHGSGVNYGMKHGKGMYYYVLDADDWLDMDALEQVLMRLLDLRTDYLCGISEQIPDLFLVDYTYENIESGKNRIRLNKQVPSEQFFSFKETHGFGPGTYLTMHSMIYRLELLREINLELPEHCFYVDNLLAYIPLPYCQSFYYQPVELYHYEVGRDDQSVNEQNFIKRIDQQLKVTKILTERYHLFADLPEAKKKLRKYMLHYLAAMYTVSVVHLILTDTKAANLKAKELWQFLKDYDQKMYTAVRNTLANWLLNLPLSNRTIASAYHLVQKVLKFN